MPRSPVYGELGHQGDIMRPGGCGLVGQEGEVHTGHYELLLPEFKAEVVLIELGQGLLQLRRVWWVRSGLPR